MTPTAHIDDAARKADQRVADAPTIADAQDRAVDALAAGVPIAALLELQAARIGRTG